MGNMWTASTAVIDNHIRQHCVVMYSTTICSYCTKTKQLLSELNIDCDVVELNLLSPSDGGHVSQDLIKKTNVRTVPQIFINGEFIGGYSEIMALKQAGSLFEKISKCSKPCFKAID